jgi:hypothetical protein
MRYVSRRFHASREVQDAVLAAAKLKTHTWVPSTMQPLAFDHDAFGTPQEQRSIVPLRQSTAVEKVEAWHKVRGKKCPLNLYANWIPAHKRFSRATLNPGLDAPNKILEKTVGYCIAVRLHSDSSALFQVFLVRAFQRNRNSFHLLLQNTRSFGASKIR